MKMKNGKLISTKTNCLLSTKLRVFIIIKNRSKKWKDTHTEKLTNKPKQIGSCIGLKDFKFFFFIQTTTTTTAKMIDEDLVRNLLINQCMYQEIIYMWNKKHCVCVCETMWMLCFFFTFLEYFFSRIIEYFFSVNKKKKQIFIQFFLCLFQFTNKVTNIRLLLLLLLIWMSNRSIVKWIHQMREENLIFITSSSHLVVVGLSSIFLFKFSFSFRLFD